MPFTLKFVAQVRAAVPCLNWTWRREGVLLPEHNTGFLKENTRSHRRRTAYVPPLRPWLVSTWVTAFRHDIIFRRCVCVVFWWIYASNLLIQVLWSRLFWFLTASTPRLLFPKQRMSPQL
jgi:hypothetical protein